MVAPAQPSADIRDALVRQLAPQHARRHAPTGQPAVEGTYKAALAGTPAPLGAVIDPHTVRLPSICTMVALQRHYRSFDPARSDEIGGRSVVPASIMHVGNFSVCTDAGWHSLSS